MNQFERDLHESLRRRQPPPGFAERVLARAAESNEPNRRWFVWNRSWQWATAAAMVVMLVGGGFLYQEHQRRVEGEKAKEQLMFALRLTGSKLRLVQERVSEIQQRRINLPLPQ